MPRATAARPVPGPVPVRARRRLAAVGAGCLLALAPALPAAAHDELTGSTPADGASVEIPPAAVELTFNEPPLALGSQVQVTGPDGQVVNAGDLAITDTVVSQPLETELPAGDYTVAWRVTSSDGHPISGELAFTAQDTTVPPDSPATPAPTSGATTEPAPAATGEPSAPATSEPAPETTTAAGAPDAQGIEDPSSGATPWVVGGVIVLLVGGTLWWLSRRRAGGGTPGSPA